MSLNSIQSLKPSKTERSALLQRVVESTPFRRATRLRDFLVYVGNEALNEVEDIHEQKIGIAVFGRPEGYDTAQDNIVRVNAMEVRKRIDLYFAAEGKDESIVFEIPRGTYVPLFKPREAEAASPAREEDAPPGTERRLSPPLAPVAAPAQTDKSGVSNRAWSLNAIGYVILALGIAAFVWAGFEARKNQRLEASLHEWSSTPALHAFWGNFFGKGQAPDIVLADTSYTLAQELTHQTLSLARYLDYQYRNIQSRDPLPPDARRQQASDLALIFSHSNGSIGDFRVARRISEMETGGGETRLVFARDYSGHALRRSNTILLGSSRSNPWTELFDSQMVYHLTYEPGSVSSYVQIDHPVGSEPVRYIWSTDPKSTVGFCVIAFLPNLTNTGSTLILAGSDSQATEAGGDFLTSEQNLKSLLALFHRTSFPNFQLLLKVSRLSGTPIQTEVLSYRTDPK